MEILSKIKHFFIGCSQEDRYLVKTPCLSGWAVRSYRTLEEAEECLKRLKKEPFIESIKDVNEKRNGEK